MPLEQGSGDENADLGYRGCKNNNLVELPNALHELIDARPFDHINVVILTFDLHGYGEIRLM